MTAAHTLNDVIRVSEAYAAFDENPTEVTLEDLEFVMGGSLEGLLRQIPGVGTALDIAKEIPGAIDEVHQFVDEHFPSQEQIDHSQAEGQASAQAAAQASQQVTEAAHAADNAAAHQAQLANGLY